MQEKEAESYEGLLSAAEGILSQDPEDVSSLNDKGVALLNLGRYKEALESLKKAVGLNPGYAPAHYNMACALTQLNHHILAFHHIDKFKEQSGEGFDPSQLWNNPHLEPLRRPPWLEKFLLVVGPEPVNVETQA